MAVTPETTVEKPTVDTRALDDALNTQMSGLPAEVRAASKTRQLAAKAQSDVDQALTAKQREIYEPIESRYREQVVQGQKQVGDIGKQLATPFEVPKETVADFSTLGGLVAIAGAMLGSSGKQSANNVLASMTGIVSGYKKGRADMISQAFKEFETNMKRLQALSTNAQTQLELASKLSATDKEKAKLVFDEIKAKYNGSIIAAKVAGDDAFTALTAANTIKQTNIAAQSAAQRIEEFKAGAETRRLQQEKLEQEIAIGKGDVYEQNGKLVYFDRVTQTVKPIEGSEGARKPGAKGQIGIIGPSAFLQSTIGKTTGDVKLDGKIADTAKAVVATNDLLERLKDPEIKTGWLLTLNRFQEQLKTLKGDKRELTDAEVQSIINGSVSSTTKNATFLKDQLFLQYQIEKEAAGGRLTVEMMRQGAKVLDPTNVTKDTYIGIIGGRRNDLYRNLQTQNLTQADIDKLISTISQGPRAGGASSTPPASSAAPSTTSSSNVQQQAIAAFGSYEPEKYEYGTNPTTGKFARRAK